MLVNCYCVKEAKEAELSVWLAQHTTTELRHLTHIEPLFYRHCLNPAASLIDLYVGWTFKAYFVDV